jgi:regulator of protease activity HflC (stomatin/prohibitin superfamily)
MFELLIPVLIVLVVSIKQINEYERGIRFSLGKFSGVMKPGWRIIIPVFQSYQKVDMRVKAVDVPNQEAMTKDNIPVNINAVIYYKIQDSEKAILEVENFFYATSQLAQTSMRNVVGEVTLDELLAKREMVSDRIKEIVDKETDPWGIKIINLELKEINLDDNLKRTISKQAEAEREKRAVIIKAEGEVIAADNIQKAAKMLSESTGGLHLRTLQTLNDLSSDQSNTIVFAIPLEILRAFEKVADYVEKKK